MAHIRLLSPLVIRQIAAGECIERPASVVKELVENSLDAGASKINIDIEEAGNQLIRISDNGGGIPKEELPLAIAAHATSKLSDADDLLRIRTFGFRGEALASISAVAEVSLSSAIAGSDSGYLLETKGDEMAPLRPVGVPQGTIVEVRNLFFNVPARRKFLKSKQVEMGQITDTVMRMALAAFDVGFQLSHNGRIVLVSAAAKSRDDRIRDLLAKESLEFFHASFGSGLYQLDAYLGSSHHHKSDTKWQFYYLNKRYVKDRIVTRALEDAYQDYIPTRRHPVAILYLDLDPALVDVNVHPTKSEVRYRDGQEVYRLVYHTVQDGLRRWELTPEIEVAPEQPPVAAPGQTGQTEMPLSQEMPEPYADRSLAGSGIGADESLPVAENGESGQAAAFATVPTATPGMTDTPSKNPHKTDSSTPIPAYEFRQGKKKKSGTRTPWAAKPAITATGPAEARFSAQELPPAAPSSPAAHCDSLLPAEAADADHPGNAARPRYFQLHQSYIIVEIPDGMLVLDQHALHERIIFERLRTELEKGKIVSQPLLFPETLNLTPEEMALLEEWFGEIGKTGLKLEKTGEREVTIHALPQLIGKLATKELVADLVEQLSQTQEIRLAEVMDHVLATMACKAAVKAGDLLSGEEIESLLRHKDQAQNPYHCPHGRPAVIKITLDEIEKYFKRR